MVLPLSNIMVLVIIPILVLFLLLMTWVHHKRALRDRELRERLEAARAAKVQKAKVDQHWLDCELPVTKGSQALLTGVKNEECPICLRDVVSAGADDTKSVKSWKSFGSRQTRHSLRSQRSRENLPAGHGDEDRDVRVLPCKHVFCSECIDPWLTSVSSACPLCKHDCLAQHSSEISLVDTTHSSHTIPGPSPAMTATRTTTQPSDRDLEAGIHPISRLLSTSASSHDHNIPLSAMPNVTRSSEHSPPTFSAVEAVKNNDPSASVDDDTWDWDWEWEDGENNPSGRSSPSNKARPGGTAGHEYRLCASLGHLDDIVEDADVGAQDRPWTFFPL
ncbi:hypothetical protein BZG36_03922 [Bifiguratus adelaidae]|uniref:RING-type domain-containing protein n=1 Tax=Bifiguratus adelaidae TaxID=1938954 RepID=A0A261XZ70_9FUNG|nr:hypothetical protein BZG36_03922 [Bifiguratus adelaidae]